MCPKYCILFSTWQPYRPWWGKELSFLALSAKRELGLQEAMASRDSQMASSSFLGPLNHLILVLVSYSTRQFSKHLFKVNSYHSVKAACYCESFVPCVWKLVAPNTLEEHGRQTGLKFHLFPLSVWLWVLPHSPTLSPLPSCMCSVCCHLPALHSGYSLNEFLFKSLLR